jgi:hypothetical protein
MQKNSVFSASRWLIYLALGGVVIFVLIWSSPAIKPIPEMDSGAFLYIGDKILEGKLPYRDVWDHKPPLIFYINALGLWLGGGSAWGAWLVEAFCLAAAAWLGYRLLEQAFGRLPAFFASLLWIYALARVLSGGNLTEEYALVFQFLALFCFWNLLRKPGSRLPGFLLGLATAACMLLRPNIAGTIAAVLIVWLVLRISMRRPKIWAIETLFIGAGIALPFLAMAAYFAANHGLGALFDQVVRYNYFYSQSEARRIWTALQSGLQVLLPQGMLVIAGLGWMAGWFYREPGASYRPLLAVAMLGLPLEIGLSTFPGRAYSHYFMSWLPTMAILVAFAAYIFLKVYRWKAVPSWSWLVAICLFAVLLVGQYGAGKWQNRDLVSQESLARDYILANTTPTDKVLIWGASAGLNFVTQRDSPTRFAYQFPLYTPGYQRPELIRQFLVDLEKNPPRYIIDTYYQSLPPIDARRRERFLANNRMQTLPEMNEVFTFIEQNYAEAGELEPDGWFVYRRLEP